MVVRVYTVVSKNPLFKLEALYILINKFVYLFNIYPIIAVKTAMEKVTTRSF